MSGATTAAMSDADLQEWCVRPMAKPRSLAIPIQKMSPKITRTTVDDASDSSADRRYEYATWQMYNRIIDYRQRHPLSDRYHQTEVTDDEREQVSLERTPRPHQSDMLAKKVSVSCEEEVFDMDL